ncbi:MULTISPECIES: two-component system response regulator RppA [Pseudanabaena]|uniref:two-component system response regulator RppA n=1 Tax=Pseudanabaena TaxID=1152 RepID=UPI002479F43F|nr:MULTISPECIES: two-component system response regulator RppA [Pseudanabaena]MEA5488966.1 two-component system response regulator RppA [Pseudanabaena sp. CCNP1317]WGS73301.1 response regulator transcription factor [Pseudanabaena galeata CCNP1313]
MKVLLVEDEVDLGTAIQRSLKQEKYVVDWAQNGKEAWNYLDCQPTEYTVAILDWMLPQLSGLELCRRLRKNQNPLPVILLTAKDRIEDRVQGLDAGADDYLIKPFGMLELLARLRALQRRSPQIQATQLKVANLVLDYNTCTIAAHDINGKHQIIQLTAKEFQLLEYFMRHPHQILTRDQILSRLWEMQAEPESNVVAAQVRLLRRRLAEYGQEKLIETVYGLGYRFNVN